MKGKGIYKVREKYYGSKDLSEIRITFIMDYKRWKEVFKENIEKYIREMKLK